MPKEKWTGYHRFCPLARGLDVVGERWALVILQELLKTNLRYGELRQRLPGIGSSVLADRLRKLEQWGLLERKPGRVGGPIVYELTESGLDLEPAIRALREWGVRELVRSGAGLGEDGRSDPVSFDVTFVGGFDRLPDEEYEWRIGEDVTTLSYRNGELVQSVGHADHPAVVVTASGAFMRKWAEGSVNWDDGRADGSVAVLGDSDAWERMLAATGFVSEFKLAEA